MEGKYTKIGTIASVIALIVTVWQLIPSSNNVTGEWTMITIVDKADLENYIGHEFEWKLHLVQKGNIIEGTAEKVKLNKTALAYNLRTRLSLNGIIKDNKIMLNYIEHGKRRETCGVFSGILTDREFNGSFSQTASSSAGRIKAHKN